jgi:hypothetical protein
MKFVVIIAGILFGIALFGFIALQVLFFLAKKWRGRYIK